VRAAEVQLRSRQALRRGGGGRGLSFARGWAGDGSAQVDSFGHARLSGIAEALAELIEKKTGFETRSVNLGHTQRGGVPTAFDRVLGQRYGLHAIRHGAREEVGRIAVLHGTDITDITIKEAIAQNRRLDQRFFDVIADLEAKGLEHARLRSL